MSTKNVHNQSYCIYQTRFNARLYGIPPDFTITAIVLVVTVVFFTLTTILIVSLQIRHDIKKEMRVAPVKHKKSAGLGKMNSSEFTVASIDEAAELTKTKSTMMSKSSFKKSVKINPEVNLPSTPMPLALSHDNKNESDSKISDISDGSSHQALKPSARKRSVSWKNKDDKYDHVDQLLSDSNELLNTIARRKGFKDD